MNNLQHSPIISLMGSEEFIIQSSLCIVFSMYYQAADKWTTMTSWQFFRILVQKGMALSPLYKLIMPIKQESRSYNKNSSFMTHFIREQKISCH